MTGKVLDLETKLKGENKEAFDRLIGLVGLRDQKDEDLRKLVAFRLKLDGETAMRQYLLKKMNSARQCGFYGRFFDFIKDDQEEKRCEMPSAPYPDEAG